MGAETVYDFGQIKDNVGLYLFGPQNYSSSEGELPSHLTSGFNLYSLSEILVEEFPFFAGKVQRLHDLYETVMQHADPLAESRAEHRALDEVAQTQLNERLSAPELGSALVQELRMSGDGRFAAWWKVRKGFVPSSILHRYASRDPEYSGFVDQSREILHEQLGRLEGVGEEMDAFKKLLREEIRHTLHSIMARNHIQMAFGGIEGYQRAQELPQYMDTALRMIPPFCERRDRLRRRLSDGRYADVYLKDNLGGLSLGSKR